MKEALKEAQKAAEMGEIPVGAVIVKDGEIISRGHNLTETTKDPTAHAEIIAIREASKVLGGWRLIGCDMYVTMEPCSMCAGALVWSRIEHLSVFNIVQDERLNHQIAVDRGIMAEESSQLVREFFRNLRNKRKKPEEE